MGLEAKCLAKIGSNEIEGKLHVDSKEIQFRAPAVAWGIPLLPTPPVKIRGEWLEIGGASFALGPAASKWADKIQNPPSRLTKLGLKSGDSVWISGAAPAQFEEECKEAGIRFRKSAALGVQFLQESGDLRGLKAIPDGTSVWLIYPKGGKTIKESEVMAAARELGWGASKTLSFDGTLTGLRFARKK